MAGRVRRSTRNDNMIYLLESIIGEYIIGAGVANAGVEVFIFY